MNSIRLTLFAALLGVAVQFAPAQKLLAQVSYPPAPADAAATAKANDALAAATAAQATATSALNATATMVKTINGVAPTNGSVTIAIPTTPDLTPYALKTQLPTVPDGSGIITTTALNAAIASATSGLATQTALASTTSTASSALAKANAACTPTVVVPPIETPVGSGGTMSAGCRTSDSVQPRITRAGSCVIATPAGTCTIVWATAFPASVTAVNIVIEPINTTAQPVICNQTTTAAQNVTAPSIRCWFARTLPATVATLTALASYDVFGQTPTSMTVQITGIPATQ